MEDKAKMIYIFNKIYGIVSILFVLMIFSQTFLVEHIKNPLLIKAFDYGFWYAFGAFSAFFVLRRTNKDHKNDFEN